MTTEKETFTQAEILQAVHFQEQYFDAQVDLVED